MNLNNFSFRQKLIGAIIAIGILLIAIFQGGLYPKTTTQSAAVKSFSSETQTNQNPHLISTNPPGLKDGVIVPSSQIVEITFSDPIENRGEVKNTLEPKIDYDIELSSDRKTVRLLPKKPLGLGQSFTFTIKQDTKFDGQKRMDSDQVFHFSTINYRGV